MHQLQMVPTDGSQVPDGTQPLKHERNGMLETIGYQWHVIMRRSTQNAPDGQGATTTLIRDGAVEWCVSSRWYSQMVSREHHPVPDGTHRWYRVNTSGMLL